MFGMGFMEIFLVLMVAIVALGPEKLPSAVVDIAKFFKKFKSGIDDAKATLDNELKISEMKQQANEFKASIGDVTSLAKVDLASINSDRIFNEDEPRIIEKKVKKEITKSTKPKKEKQTKRKKETISLKTEDV